MRTFAASIAFAALSSAAAAQSGVTIHAVGNATLDAPELYTIDAASGQVLTRTPTSGIGDVVGPRTLKALDFSPSGTLFGFTQVPSSRLYTIDPATAAGAQVGNDWLVPAFEGGLAIVDDNFAYATNGFLAVENYLLSVNLNTGFNDTIVLLDRSIDLSGAALRDDGAIIGMDTRNLELPAQLVVIDPETGSVTTLAALAGHMGGVAAGLEIHDGVGYLVNNSLPPFVFPTIYTFDPYTGEQTFLSTLNVRAEISGIAIKPSEPEPCPGDADGDNSVGTSDLLIVLANWGQATAGGAADGDFDESGTVGTSDLLVLLAAWGTSC
jgi:hypothetical protein